MLPKVRAVKFNFWLLGILAFVFLLRVPSFFEPYWYGDEGIYLALGQMMGRGAVLYRDIWDNKPPLLYLIYALAPTLLWAKISAILFVLGTCVGIYLLSKKIFEGKWSTLLCLLTTSLTGVFLSIPLFEGTIANAELYFTLPIVWGAYLVISFWGRHKDLLKLDLLGFLAAIAFLLKVPAVFDFAAFFLFIFVQLLENFWPKRDLKELVSEILTTFIPVGATFVLPIAIVVVYFFINGAIKDFLIASFSQNASYVAVGSGTFSKLSNPLFVKGVILVAGGLLLVAGYFKKIISRELLFLALWFGFSLYGALLSNRPYMHYLLQIVPSVSMLVIYVWANLRKYWFFLFPLFSILYALFSMFQGAFALPTPEYYQNWFDFVSERKLREDYVNWFDPRTINSYQAAAYIEQNTDPDDPIFVWGDASFIYVLANRPAATKFIQAHHLTTIDPVNYDLVIARLEEVRPKYILISRPGHFAFPKLEELVARNYQEVAVFEDLHVYGILKQL